MMRKDGFSSVAPLCPPSDEQELLRLEQELRRSSKPLDEPDEPPKLSRRSDDGRGSAGSAGSSSSPPPHPAAAAAEKATAALRSASHRFAFSADSFSPASSFARSSPFTCVGAAAPRGHGAF